MKKEIEDKTDFSIAFEGIYKWIVFDSSKQEEDSNLPALNRYFGVFENRTLKARGIELRRHHTPPLFAKFQLELLQKMSSVDNIDEIKRIIPELKTYKKYNDFIYQRKVRFSELVYQENI